MKILVYPHYDNPYQELLYKTIKQKKDFNILYFDDRYIYPYQYIGKFIFPIGLITCRLKGYKIFHLHWQNFGVNVHNPYLNKLLSTIYTFYFLLWLIILRYKLVWTIHNITPHEEITINDSLITKFLCRISDKKIVNSKYVLNQLNMIKVDTERTSIIPIGNFIGYYLNNISRNVARNKLNIAENDFTLLFFGLIRKYKGIEYLMQSYKMLSNIKNIHLVIAGKVYDKDLYNQIVEFNKNFKDSTSIFLRNIQDDEVQVFMNGADVVVFPFNKITTSSSILLPLSFSTPIIYPQLEPFKNLPKNIGYSYDITKKNALPEIILKAYNNKNTLEHMGVNGYEYAKSLDWEFIAKRTYMIYDDLQ